MAQAGGDPGGTGPDEPEEQLGIPDADGNRRWRDFMAEAAEAAEAPPGEAGMGMPTRLCAACVRLLRVAGGSLSLAGGARGSLVTLCASDEVAAELAEIQYTLGEGPCRCATGTGAPVSAVDVTSGADAQRWPLFTRRAVEAGAGSAFSFPMTGDSRVLGTVDLYNTVPSVLEESELRLGMRAADAVGLTLLSLHHGQPPSDEQPSMAWWADAEANHEEVHRAVGMLMVRLGVSAEEALARLRARAFSQDRTVTGVARDVTGRRDDFRPGD